jgi:hypothetical protein
MAVPACLRMSQVSIEEHITLIYLAYGLKMMLCVGSFNRHESDGRLVMCVDLIQRCERDC